MTWFDHGVPPIGAAPAFHFLVSSAALLLVGQAQPAH
jgi:hypothetical protein